MLQRPATISCPGALIQQSEKTHEKCSVKVDNVIKIPICYSRKQLVIFSLLITCNIQLLMAPNPL